MFITFWCQDYSGCCIPNMIKLVDFSSSYSKNKRGTFLRHTVVSKQVSKSISKVQNSKKSQYHLSANANYSFCLTHLNSLLNITRLSKSLCIQLLIQYDAKLKYTRLETQLSLTNRVTHLCKCNGVADLLKTFPSSYVLPRQIWSF